MNKDPDAFARSRKRRRRFISVLVIIWLGCPLVYFVWDWRETVSFLWPWLVLIGTLIAVGSLVHWLERALRRHRTPAQPSNTYQNRHKPEPARRVSWLSLVAGYFAPPVLIGAFLGHLIAGDPGRSIVHNWPVALIGAFLACIIRVIYDEQT